MLRLFCFVLTALSAHVIAELGCRNEKGTLVDWYALYKLPRNSESKNPLEVLGEAYTYLDSSVGTWVGSKISVEHPSSYMAKTYSQVISGREQLGYLIYNDQLPNSISSSTHYGHTKGILATDGKDGFWLVHSVPRFPSHPENGSYDYPDNGKQNGQSLICITFSFDQLPTIVNLFRYNRPNIYSRHSIKELSSLPQELQIFFTGRPRYVRKPPWSTTAHIKSKGGQTFTVFAKHQKYGKDLYDSLVAPSLATSLYVQSWLVGRGTPLDSDCDDKYQVYNVEVTKVKYGNNSEALFKTTNDHSKWAASASKSSSWVCVGDINRMESQFKRGGGTVCLNSKPAWKAYTSAIVDTEGCNLANMFSSVKRTKQL